MKKILLVLAAIFLLTGCSTLSVDVDYDTSYDFNKKTNYTVAHSDRVGSNSLIDDRITAAIKESLDAKTYTEVAKEKADLVFVFHVNVQDKSDVTMDYQMIGYGGYGFGGGFGGMIATPTTYNYTEGKLIIDALNPKTNKIVWRGIASDELSQNTTTPQEKTQKINEVVSQLMSKFPPKSEK